MLVSGNCPGRKQSTLFAKLRAGVAIGCLLAGTAPLWAQAQQNSDSAASGLPSEPVPNFTQPLYMRPGTQDFAKGRGYWPNVIGPYLPRTVEPSNFANSLQLQNLVKNGKIRLSLSDAVLLALQNNYDIAIQRLNLNIADTDILRTRAGMAPQGTSTSLVTNTLGNAGTSVTTGAPGGLSVAGTGLGGIVSSTLGAGPAPAALDPNLQGTIQLGRQKAPQLNTLFSGGLPYITSNTDEYNFTYNEGFRTGTTLQVTFDNQRQTSDSPFNIYSPAYTTSFNAQFTQPLLQGFGWGVNSRYIVQAVNDRRIADSVFRSQLLYTVNQVENIYWGLVSDYENVQSKQRALQQSTALVKDDEKQLQVGSMAPLDVVNAKSGMASDEQALISARSALEYQQLLMKQAIARNLDDPALANAPVIPTDRVNLAETPEERMSTNELVREADANSPAVEQDVLDLKNDRLTLKAVKNGLLPTLDAYVFYGATGLGGIQSPGCKEGFGPTAASCPPGTFPTHTYASALGNLVNSSGSNKGAGFTLNIPIRNRPAQAEMSRAKIEYEQAQMYLQQLYVKIRMQVIADQYALTNDRASVRAAEASRSYQKQSLDAEIKKLHLGAATTADVLQQQRNLATAEATLISARNTYAVDRAALEEAVGSTLDRYGISIVNAATGQINTPPVIPGIAPAAAGPEVTQPTQKQELQQQEQQEQEHSQPQQR